MQDDMTSPDESEVIETDEVEVEAQEPEQPEVEEAEESEPELDEEGNPVEREEEPDLTEVEYEGKQYKLPPELRDALLRNADYTQKTQAIAEQRKTLEATLERLGGATEQEQQAQQAVWSIDAQLSQFQNVDWDAWDQADPNAANRARFQLMELRQQREYAIKGVEAAQAEATAIAQHEHAKRIQEGIKALKEQMPDFTQEKAARLLDEGQKTYGFSAEELQSIDDPRMVIALNDALEYRKSKATAAKKTVAAKQDAIKPAAKVKGATPVIKGLDDRLSTEEWIKRRNAQTVRQ